MGSGTGRGLSAAGLASRFAIGAVGGLIGDMCHVESGTTVYLEDPLPYVWKSQLWFPFMVGAGTAALGWIRVRIDGGEERRAGDADRLRRAALMIAAVVGLYALTALMRGEPQPAAIVLVYALALVIAAAFATGPGDLVCACLAALFGVGTEIVLAAADTFAYASDIGRFAGVATWLPGLYLAYGVVAGQLGLLLAAEPREAPPSG